MKSTRRRWVASAIAIITATMVGVGVASRSVVHRSPAPLSHTVASSPSAVPSPLSDVDLAFIATMATYQHHALQLAALATVRAHNPDARSLGAQIHHSHQQQADSLTTLTGQDNAPGTPPPPVGAPQTSSFAGPTVPIGDDDIRALDDAPPGDFDKLFVELMTRQDQACLELATDEQQRGTSTAIRTFAGPVVETDTTEIAALMNLTGWL